VSLDHAILGFLSERPRSGYDLKTRCFDSEVSAFWTADQAQVYRTLERLARAKFVSVARRRQSGKPDRKLYEITYAGREELSAWLSTAAGLPPLRDPYFLQLYFGASLDDDALLGVMSERRDAHQSRLEALRADSARLSADHTLSQRAMTLRQTAYDGAIARERAAIDWLDDCIEAVTQGALPGSKAGGIGQRHLFGS
jgi:DNA-binding PadR family transcriptional regulator